MRKTFLSIGCICLLQLAYAQQPVMQHTQSRKTTTLNGSWKYIVDPYENGFYDYRYRPFESREDPGNGAFFVNAKRKNKADLIEYDFDKMDSLQVPGDWNTQEPELFYYEGTVWYKKTFDYTKSKTSHRVFLYFGGANYRTDVYLNGKKLGKHIGGFTPFQFEITQLLRDTQNHLVVKVDNKRYKEAVPTLNTDWWNYGGITRDVKLIETPGTYIHDYSLNLSQSDFDQLEGTIQLNGKNLAKTKVQIDIPELDITTSYRLKTDGYGRFRIGSKKIKYWSPDSPYLYKVVLSSDQDTIIDHIGFRSITTKGADILLNGQSIFLKGISIHEESPIHGGRAHSKEDARQLLQWAKSLGCNYVRLAHYPHNEYMPRLADEMGLLVWEEIPVYWTIDWENEGTFINARNQLAEMIARDKNRASVIIWSMANETPNSEARNHFLERLASFTKKEDSTRLISAALEQKNYLGDTETRTIDDPFSENVDILSFNQYIGWYDGGIEKCQRIKWHITQDKPIIISEFGAGAKYGLHGEKDERWTEEYQEHLYKETLKMLDGIEQLQGMSPWLLVDFRSPRRVLPEVQDNYNRKGLISEKGELKKAFYILQQYYKKK